MKFIWIILYIVTFTMCSLHQHEHIRLVSQMEKKFEKSIYDKYGLTTLYTHGSINDQIKTLGFAFQQKGTLPKDRLRTLLVEITDLYLKEINKNQQIIKYMKSYPFTEKDLNIKIYVKEESNSRVLHPEIVVASATYGKVSFYTVETRDSNNYKLIDVETFQEASDLVRKL